MSKTTRVTIDLDEIAMDRLEELLVSTEAASKAEVIRRALRFYALTQACYGPILVSDKDGNYTRLVVL